MIFPQEGDIIYIPSDSDITGGLAMVKETGIYGKDNPNVTCWGFESHTYSWRYLQERQAKLREHFGPQTARYDNGYTKNPVDNIIYPRVFSEVSYGQVVMANEKFWK